MANLQETATWENHIYQIEENDPVHGGADGITNKPLKQLSNRTLYLRKILTEAGQRIAPKTITGTTKNSVDLTGHTHEIARASTTQAGIVQTTNDTGLDSELLALSAKAGKNLAQQIAQNKLDADNKFIQNSKKSSSVSSTSNDTVATSGAVKTAYDKGVEALNVANGKYTAQDATTARKGLVQLADNLTTNEANKALTAAQGMALNEKIDGLQIGGRNYVRNSALEKTSTDEYLKYQQAPYLKDVYLSHDTWMLSFDIKVAVAGVVRVYSSNGSGVYFSVNVEVEEANKYFRRSVIIKPIPHQSTPNNANGTIEFFGIYKTGRIITVKNVKLEKGSKATDWTLAPEDSFDVQNDIGDRDLNSVVSPGTYGQHTTANASVARNYPVGEAGALVVTPSAYGVQQEYTTFASNQKYVRGRGDNGWRTWQRIDGADWATGVRNKPTTLDGYATTSNQPIIINHDAALVRGQRRGTNSWFVGATNNTGNDVALHSYVHNTGVTLKSDRLEANKDLYVGTNKVWHAGNITPAAQVNLRANIPGTQVNYQNATPEQLPYGTHLGISANAKLAGDNTTGGWQLVSKGWADNSGIYSAVRLGIATNRLYFQQAKNAGEWHLPQEVVALENGEVRRELIMPSLKLTQNKLTFGDDILYKNNSANHLHGYHFLEDVSSGDNNSRGNAHVFAKKIAATHVGQGAYVHQYNSGAPFMVDEQGSVWRDTYHPFVKGRVRTNGAYGAAFSFGYTSNQNPEGDGYGRGIVHLIEDNGRDIAWSFEHDGRMAGIDFDAQGKRLSQALMQGDIAVLTGVINHGGTLPLPAGFSEAQCKFFISVNNSNRNNATWDVREGGRHIHTRIECWLNGRVVHAKYHRYDDDIDAVNNHDMNVNYLVIGVK